MSLGESATLNMCDFVLPPWLALNVRRPLPLGGLACRDVAVPVTDKSPPPKKLMTLSYCQSGVFYVKQLNAFFSLCNIEAHLMQYEL